jgi:hypothetical protein
VEGGASLGQAGEGWGGPPHTHTHTNTHMCIQQNLNPLLLSSVCLCLSLVKTGAFGAVERGAPPRQAGEGWEGPPTARLLARGLIFFQ